MVRKMLMLLVVLSVLAVVADRVSVRLAERAVADQLSRTAGITGTPLVEVGGTPFLTQVFAGRYDEVRVEAKGVQRDGVRVAELDATLTGVHMSVGEALRGDVNALRVDGVRATALVAYADLARRSGLAEITLQPVGSALRVIARITVLGRTVTATAVSGVSLRGGFLSVTTRSASVVGGASSALVRAAAQRLAFRVAVGQLPFGLSLTRVEITRDGLRLQASSGPTVLTAR